MHLTVLEFTSILPVPFPEIQILIIIDNNGVLFVNRRLTPGYNLSGNNKNGHFDRSKNKSRCVCESNFTVITLGKHHLVHFFVGGSLFYNKIYRSKIQKEIVILIYHGMYKGSWTSHS